MIFEYTGTLDKEKLEAQAKFANWAVRIFRLRDADWPVLALSEISADDKAEIQQLVEKLGTKVVQWQHNLVSNVRKSLVETKEEYKVVVKQVGAGKYTYPIVRYAFDLLQYMLVHGNNEIPEVKSLQKLETAGLIAKGKLTENLLITEHRLLHMYSKIDTLKQQHKAGRLTASQLKEKLSNFVEVLAPQIELMKERVRLYPANMFARYVKFLVNYTAINVYDAMYQAANEALTEDEKHTSALQQQAFVDEAIKDVKVIRDFLSSSDKRSSFLGKEYCFGNELFRRLPSSDINEVYKEVCALKAEAEAVTPGPEPVIAL